MMLDTAPQSVRPSLRTVMRAAVVSAPGHLEIINAPTPQPQAGELLIEVEHCGVCASNLARWEGQPWFTYPSEPGELGHEAVGRIAAIGQEVWGWEIGERVAFLSNHAYAEYDVARCSDIVSLPESIDPRYFLGEPLACAWNIFERSEVKAGDTVAIVGAGFLGEILTQLAVARGAEVLAVSRRAYAREIAQKFGAAAVFASEPEYQAIAQVEEFTGGLLCDIVIEATGKQAPLDLAAKLTKERGRLVIAGYHQDGPRQVNMQLWNWRGLDVINAHERDSSIYIEGMKQALTAVEKGVIDTSPLISHFLPLEKPTKPSTSPGNGRMVF